MMTSGLRSVRRRPALLAAAALVTIGLLVAVVIAVATGGRPESDADAVAGSSAAAETSALPADATVPPLVPPADPAAPPVTADALPPVLSAVELDQSVTVEEVTVSLVSLEAIDAEATGPGNVSGPALRATIRLQNGTGADLPLDAVSVNLSFGSEATPGSPVEDASRRLFRGVLAPGEAADGVYVFGVPVDQRDAVTVEVSFRAGAPIAVFRGAAD